jgi:hypothetical protein
MKKADMNQSSRSNASLTSALTLKPPLVTTREVIANKTFAIDITLRKEISSE